MLQLTQVHKITRVVLVTRRAFWGQNPAACSRVTAPPPNCKSKATARGKTVPHNGVPRGFGDSTSDFKLHPEAAWQARWWWGTMLLPVAPRKERPFPNSPRWDEGW